MLRFLWHLILRILFGSTRTIPRIVRSPLRLLYDAALTMATVFVGRQGTGKTMALAAELWELIKAHPDQSFFIFDWSGGLANALYRLALSDPEGSRHLGRFIHDEMGGRMIQDGVYIMPLPEFSEEYDSGRPWLERVEDQVDRVVRTFTALNADLVERNPTMGGRPIKSLLPNLLLLVNAIRDDEGRPWQITDVVKLLNPDRRKNALKLFGHYVKKAQAYFKHHHTGDSKLNQEQEEALADILDVLNNRRIRASVGYHTPAWTPAEVVRDGLIVICDGSNLNNNQRQKDYEYLRRFYLVLDEIHKRPPSVPGQPPINWVMDEVYTFTEIPSIARLLAHLPSEYRSRYVQLFVVIQTLKQLAGEEDGKKGLEDVFWSFGNVVCFALLDVDDGEEVSRQFFPFEPGAVKVPARRGDQHDIMVSRDEQIARHAYEIQHLPKRACYVRRFINEEEMDRITYIPRTRELQLTATHEDVEALKDELVRERGVLLTEARTAVNSRRLGSEPLQTNEPPGV